MGGFWSGETIRASLLAKDEIDVEPKPKSGRSSRSNLAQELEKRAEENTKSAGFDLQTAPGVLGTNRECETNVSQGEPGMQRPPE